MSTKKGFKVIVLLLAGFLAIAIPVSGQIGFDTNNRDTRPSPPPPPTSTPFELPPIQPTASGEDQQEIKAVPFNGLTTSEMELNRVLGIPIEEIEKMSSYEIAALFIKNAELLGVVCYEERYDERFKAFITVKTCGSKVFKPKSREGYIAPSPTPNNNER